MSGVLIAWWLVLFGVTMMALVIAIMYDDAKTTERQRRATRQRIQAAERDIAEIGRQTRAAIMEEVQRRLRQGKP